ncbi:alginate lyase family protein [Aporhodopirellula aestuarii]|uniref:Alginate lyase family protein n=1 Tax=Aporhodopirellula aestuarii TaxID=2950107 RepID=A0ABT0UB60_9BACT|nr:alginate lyase family protein [Aporhodopirellula aestuarii]MCM2374045.1 alginate lyase family protein [Aporhodopirellula aestuarii]
MKNIVLVLAVLATASSVRADDIESSAEPAKPFIHPGILHNRTELAFIRQKIDVNEEPWASAWKQLQTPAPPRSRSRSRSRPSSNSRRRSSQTINVSSLDYTPSPRAEVVRGASNNPNIGSSDFSNDSIAAYSHALQWCLTGKKEHAAKSIEILNAWSETLTAISGHDAKLLIGMAGMGYCNAAELLRHTDAGWKTEDQAKFEQMLREIFYPTIEDFYPSANGNWDASMIQTMMAMGVFLDDRNMFDRAAEYFLHGEGNGAIENYFNEFGECQESGRDQAHTQMGLGFLACACEIAWKQGVDLYGASKNRLALGYEYTAKYNLGEEVPYEPYESFQGRYHYRNISSNSRGRFAPIYERVVNHYQNRIGFPMPYSSQVAKEQRPEGFSTTFIPWGTLTCYAMPNEFDNGDVTP